MTLLTLRELRDDFLTLTNGIFLFDDGNTTATATTLQFVFVTSLKWTAIFLHNLILTRFAE